ncbi:hypothetical protein AAC387_Pa04g2241 [Persea americana]
MIRYTSSPPFISTSSVPHNTHSNNTLALSFTSTTVADRVATVSQVDTTIVGSCQSSGYGNFPRHSSFDILLDNRTTQLRQGIQAVWSYSTVAVAFSSLEKDGRASITEYCGL